MRQENRSSLRVSAWQFTAVGLLTGIAPLHAQVQLDTRAVALEFSGRLQFQVQTSSCGSVSIASACGEEAPVVDMLMRRARLSVEAEIDDRLSVKLEPDFTSVGGLSLKDAWGRYAFSDAVAVRAGHVKRPFDGFQLISSSKLPFERSVVVPGVDSGDLPSYSELAAEANLSDRDVGVMLEGGAGGGRVEWWLGVFTGGSDSRSRDTNSEKQFIGRVKIALGGGDSPIEVSGALALTDAPYTAAGGEAVAQYYANYELWAGSGDWDDDGLLAQIGLLAGRNPTRNDLGGSIDLAAGEDMTALLAWQGVGAYRFAVGSAPWIEAVTPFLRVSYADPTDAGDDEVLGFTPGVSIYFHRRNRLALSWDLASFAADGIGSEHSLKAQMQFHF